MYEEDDDDEGFSDEQLSRLGLDVQSESYPTVTSNDVANSYTIADANIRISDGIYHPILRINEPEDMYIGDINIEEYVQLRIDQEIAPLETRITQLEDMIRRLREDNG